jgi:hypothetical protein
MFMLFRVDFEWPPVFIIHQLPSVLKLILAVWRNWMIILKAYTVRSKSFRTDFIKNRRHVSDVYLISSRFWTATSLVVTYKLPYVTKLRIPPKKFYNFRHRILWQLFVHFRHPWCIKRTEFTRHVATCTLSKINKWTWVCEQMLVDSTWSMDYPNYRSSCVV